MITSCTLKYTLLRLDLGIKVLVNVVCVINQLTLSIQNICWKIYGWKWIGSESATIKTIENCFSIIHGQLKRINWNGVVKPFPYVANDAMWYTYECLHPLTQRCQTKGHAQRHQMPFGFYNLILRIGCGMRYYEFLHFIFQYSNSCGFLAFVNIFNSKQWPSIANSSFSNRTDFSCHYL